MRLLVTGDRMWRDTALLWHALDAFAASHTIDMIVEGCATGADAAAEFWANKHLVELDHHPVTPDDWQRFRVPGRRNPAGAIRNREMLRTKPDHVLAFHEDIEMSHGTKDMVKIARAAGVPVTLFPLVEKAPWWFDET